MWMFRRSLDHRLDRKELSHAESGFGSAETERRTPAGVYCLNAGTREVAACSADRADDGCGGTAADDAVRTGGQGAIPGKSARGAGDGTASGGRGDAVV